MPNFCVIGNGYIGGSVGALFRKKGFIVTGTSTQQEKVEMLTEYGVNGVLLDATNPYSSYDFLDEQDGVLISISPNTGTKLEDYQKTFNVALENIVTALQHRKLHITYLSSAGVYGDQNGQLVDETSALDHSHPIVNVLIEAEKKVLRLGDNACVLRLGGIYSPILNIRKYLKNSAGEKIEKNGSHRCSWIHAEDVVNSVYLAYEKGLTGIYNVVDDCKLTRRELSNTICDDDGLPPVIWDNKDLPDARITNAQVSNQKIKSEGFVFKHTSMLD